MTQPVLEIEDLHLSFPGYKAAERSLAWWVNPVPVSP